MIATVMWPSTEQQVVPAFPGVFDQWYEKLSFRNWKRWMRAEPLLSWMTLLSGVATYYAGTGQRSANTGYPPILDRRRYKRACKEQLDGD